MVVKEIELQNGMVALVDDEDYERVSRYIWSVSVSSKISLLVTTNIGNKSLTLSRFILNAQHNEKIIYKNGDRLDCRKENILLGGYTDVVVRVRGNKNSSSRYKGVYWAKTNNKWVANIKVNGKVKYLGGFSNEDDAAQAYNRAALEYFGEHAYQNVIGEDNSAGTIAIDKRKQSRSKSKYGFRGISKSHEKWKVQIVIKKKAVYLGVFSTKEQAAKAYDKKAYELYGEKAILNFPENIEEYKRDVN